MAYTTDTALFEAMQAAVADGSFLTAKRVTKGDRTIEYHSAKEFWENYYRLKTLAAHESGNMSFRTYARHVAT